MHRPAEAIPELEAVANAVDGGGGWSLLGRAYRSARRSKQAVTAYEEALRRGSSKVGDLLGLHHASWQAGQGGRIDLIERALGLEPDHSGGWFALAQARQAAGDRGGADRARLRYASLARTVQARLSREEQESRLSMVAADALASIATGDRDAATRRLAAAKGSEGLIPLARIALGSPASTDLEATVAQCVHANR